MFPIIVAMLASFSASAAHRQVHVQAQAHAHVRIERPAAASNKDWDNAPRSSRREISIRDDQGRWIRLRLIEFE